MRPTASILIGLLLMLPLMSGASVSQYLGAGEEVTGEETFTADGSVYTLAYVGGEPGLLLRGDGSVVTEPQEISRALMLHFSELYYPSPAELNSLRGEFELYDWSRNNGDFYNNMSIKLPGMSRSVGIEEEVCRYSLYLNVFPCTNSTNCVYSAMMLCDELGDAIGCSDPRRDVQPHVEKFAFASNNMTAGMNAIFGYLGNLSPGNIYGSLTAIGAIADNLDDYEKEIEGTKFRLPQGGERCTDCMGLCPRIIINESHLESAKEKLDAMLGETALLGDYDALGESMGEDAVERVEMARLSAERAYYHSLYDTDRERAQKAVEEADDVLAVVSNSSLNSYAARAEALMAKIDADLAAGNFSDVNASMAELRAKTNIIEAAVPSQWAIYNSTERARAEASLSLFILETSSLSGEQEAAAAALAARKSALDRGFVSGLSAERYVELANEYNNITQGAEPIVQGVEQSTAYLSPFRAAAKRTNEGLESLVVAIQPMDRSEKDRLSDYAPAVLSAVSFFSLGSLLTFAFLFVFAGLSSRLKGRGAMFVGFLILGLGLLAVGAVSAGVYLTLKSSSSEADFSTFRSSLQGADHASVVLETEGVSAGAASEMRGCAASIASHLSPRSVDVYEKLDGECVAGQTTLGDCYDSIQEPIITLRYSAMQARPEFSAVFVDSAVFSGDEQYFRECEFAEMLSVEPASLAEEPQNESSEWVIE
ncbi:MAG: hypothetical protein AB1657_01005 [Candidatus Micrarchaeota archaeon]